ncbi:hypothetical protein JTB14_034880 [Gonioctena quinquepunctata]|nr:hypothetical protein JTB14_034880 [Gonioctena quinquepunctata]
MKLAKTPSSTKKPPLLNISLSNYNKCETPNIVYRQKFRELLNHQQFDRILYTDASKEANGTGYAVTTSDTTIVTYNLPDLCRIHTAEHIGIQLTQNYVQSKPQLLFGRCLQ